LPHSVGSFGIWNLHAYSQKDIVLYIVSFSFTYRNDAIKIGIPIYK
jgi:hypothetical protein